MEYLTKYENLRAPERYAQYWTKETQDAQPEPY